MDFKKQLRKYDLFVFQFVHLSNLINSVHPTYFIWLLKQMRKLIFIVNSFRHCIDTSHKLIRIKLCKCKHS